MHMSSEEEQVRRVMNAFFQAGGVQRYKGPITNPVVEVFVKMLLDAQRCLNETSWVYRPDPEADAIDGLLSQINMRVIERMTSLNEESSCIEFAIEKYMEPLKQAIMASQRAR